MSDSVFKTSKIRHYALIWGSMFAIMVFPAFVLELINSDGDYIAQAIDMWPMHIIIPSVWLFYLKNRVISEIRLNDNVMIGPQWHGHLYYSTKLVTLNLAECQNGLQTRNWFTQMIGLYYLKDQQGQGISVFKHFYDKALFKEINLRIPAGSLSQ